MKDPKKIRRLIIVSMCAAFTLGMMDYETTSAVQLFSTWGNIIALLMYTGLFMLLGLMLYGMYKLLSRVAG